MDSMWKKYGIHVEKYGIHQPFHGIHPPLHGIHLEFVQSTPHSIHSIWNNLGRFQGELPSAMYSGVVMEEDTEDTLHQNLQKFRHNNKGCAGHSNNHYYMIQMPVISLLTTIIIHPPFLLLKSLQEKEFLHQVVRVATKIAYGVGTLCSHACVESSTTILRPCQVIQCKKLLQRLTYKVVFESPVWSALLMPRGFNCNRNRSTLFPEVKKTRLDRKILRPVSVCTSFNRSMTGL
ncbi:uncharacterized protein LACBIDRAFT_328529 [Laccaria bicolor S238N-H82]|uniref:Predicted protein n=1 Tax=Laccaria bicolor (strain S238N-H82 / ATCC MYA-4686) TaxID=486041 RepID=B0DF59_LACBS|nr:uncharacterized protein LACBIDRAFT_328529 [Laccaria bicolor S238N-H82]EDR06656.1 predicted protein [Laccaria bicolor S238N-H82]|eukprot:XP_001882503.1 predicted protein [Laccaria bicolor S238N-H82]